ncbi:MAG: hypothetical protein HY903_16835 [Deltaproteobacteria bacterium]|nr:hypothetical protein [Deltaproteobacteria bacterium]
MGGGFGDPDYLGGGYDTYRSRSPVRTERASSTERSSTNGVSRTKWSRSYEIDLPQKKVTSGVVDGLVKRSISYQEHGDLTVQKVTATSVRELKAEWWRDDCNTLTEAEGLRILSFLEGQVKAGFTLKRADWNDGSTETSGSFLFLQKPGAAKATLIDVTTFAEANVRRSNSGSRSGSYYDDLRDAPGGIFAEINRRAGGNI